MVMVDSGHQVSNGDVDFHNVYSDMVDAELIRPPQAEIAAHFSRVGSHFTVEINLTNTAGFSLGYDINRATVHVVVYQQDDTLQSGHVTRRHSMAATYQNMTSLANGDSAVYTLTTPDLSDVNWNRLHLLVLVDYRPGVTTGACDMLQAALAVPEAGPGFKLYLPVMVR